MVKLSFKKASIWYKNNKFFKWCERLRTINNLYEESKSGVLLGKVLDKVKPGKMNWKIIDKNPNNPLKVTFNYQEVTEASEKSKYTIIGIGAQRYKRSK